MILINDKIKSEQLKTIRSMLKNLTHLSKYFPGDIFDLRKESVSPSYFLIFHPLYKFISAHYKFFFIIAMFLNAIVAQMFYWVIELVDVVLLTAYAEIGVAVDEDLQGLDGGEEDPLSDVKLAVVARGQHVAKQQRTLDVLLNDLWSRSLFAEGVYYFVFVVETEDS